MTRKAPAKSLESRRSLLLTERGLTTAASGYPLVDLSHLPVQDQKKYLPRVEEDYTEFERLREQVRPLVPPGVHLWPGTLFGPMHGSARGEFGPLTLAHPWTLLMRREPLEHLQAEGLRGLKGCRTGLRFRKKNPPELLEMELLPRGGLHPDCLPRVAGARRVAAGPQARAPQPCYKVSPRPSRRLPP